MPRFSDSLLKRGENIRRSLGIGSKKVKDKTHPNTVPQSSFEEKNEEKEEEEVCQEMEETYTLPDIPHTPLSGTASPISIPVYPRIVLLAPSWQF